MFLRGGGTDDALILVTGGARSGKSRFALELAKKGKFRHRLFVATGVPCDQEMRLRIARHRRERTGRWATLEEPLKLPERLKSWFQKPPRFTRGFETSSKSRRLNSGTLILLDCLPTFVTNHLLAKTSPREIESKIRDLLRTCRGSGRFAILVTNEVGLGLVPDNPMGRIFRDLLGRINQSAADAANEVYLLVSGVPMRLK